MNLIFFIKKGIFFPLLCFLFLCAPVGAKENSTQTKKIDDFYAALTLLMDDLAIDYSKATGKSLRVQVLDTQDPNAQNFFNNARFVNKAVYMNAFPQPLISVIFDANARYKGKSTAACLLRYNGDKRDKLLGNYEKANILDKREILFYIATHEFGHCMGMHQASLGNNSPINSKQHEILSDKVAIAYFVSKGQIETAEKIIKLNETKVTGELHRHPQELKNFLNEIKQMKIRGTFDVKNLLDAYNLSLKKI